MASQLQWILRLLAATALTALLLAALWVVEIMNGGPVGKMGTRPGPSIKILGFLIVSGDHFRREPRRPERAASASDESVETGSGAKRHLHWSCPVRARLEK